MLDYLYAESGQRTISDNQVIFMLEGIFNIINQHLGTLTCLLKKDFQLIEVHKLRLHRIQSNL